MLNVFKTQRIMKVLRGNYMSKQEKSNVKKISVILN